MVVEKKEPFTKVLAAELLPTHPWQFTRHEEQELYLL